MKIETLKYGQRGYYGNWLLVRDPLKRKSRPDLKLWVNWVVSGLRPNIDIPHLSIQIVPILTNKEFNNLTLMLKQILPAKVLNVTIYKRIKKQ